MRRRTITITALLVALLTTASPAAAAVGNADDGNRQPTPVTYVPPVDAPVIDTFRPPATPYGPGNRGIDYATTPDQPVAAAAAGEVVFAGRVGTGLHVVVLHDDGIRTSYSFLGSITVRRGDHLEGGDVVGTADATTPLHFGARAPTPDANGDDVYLDPLQLLGETGDANANDDDQPRDYLVADPHPEQPLTEAEERSRLAQMLRGVGNAATNAATRTTAWATDAAEAALDEKLELARILLDDVVDLGAPIPVYEVVAALRWQDEQATCTPATTPVPPPPHERRIAILVGGFGSATGHAAILDLDTHALGYDDRDVVQFNYRPDGRPYTPADSETDLDQAATRLAAQLHTVSLANPNVPIDLIAHSQGGLVARAAVTLHGARPALLVTLATPHHGDDLATAEVGLHLTTPGALALDTLTDHVTEPHDGGLDLDQRSIHQMSETSTFVDELDAHPLPPPTQTRTLSIAVRGDPIVANHLSRLEGAANAVITTTGAPNEHNGLPGAAATTVELRRALAGQQPTCRTLVDALADEAIGRQTSQLQDGVGFALTTGALALDAGPDRAVANLTGR